MFPVYNQSQRLPQRVDRHPIDITTCTMNTLFSDLPMDKVLYKHLPK